MVLNKAQQKALATSNGRSGFAYFMEMGMGKTLLALREFMINIEAGAVTCGIVVCPNSFKSGWLDEISKHGLVINGHIYESGSSDNENWLRRKGIGPRLLIINYEAIRSGTTLGYIEKYIVGQSLFAVFDESIQLKNNKALQTKAAITIGRYAVISRVLSGKPIAQGPHDLWGQFRAIGMLNGVNYYAFRGRYCRMGGWQMKQVVGTQNEAELAQLMAPFTFWASKKEYLTDLPDKSYTTREYKLHPILQDHYDDMYHEFVVWLDNEQQVTVDAAITKYIKMSQIQCGFIIQENGEPRELVPAEKNTRLQLLLETAENVEGKIVVPYFHKCAGKLLYNALKEYGPTVIGGGMTPEQIEQSKTDFNKDPACRVLLGQIRATKYGHTLLGGPRPFEDNCHTMLFFENTYSLDDRTQIEDRIHRIGQTNPCLYIDMYGTTLDRKVVKALQHKENIFQTIVSSVKSAREAAE